MDGHKHGEHDEMQISHGFWQSLVVSGQPTQAVEPAKAALDHPPARQQHGALFRLQPLDDLKLDAFVACSLRRFFAGVSLIGKRHLDSLSRGLLDLTRQFPDLRAFLFVGQRHMHCKQLPQGINRHVDLAGAFALVAVVTRARLTLAGRLQCACVENDRAGLATALLRNPEDRAQVIDHGLEAACLNPALRLLVDPLPRW